MLIYDRIKIVADLRHISVHEIADATGISINTMRNWNKTDATISNLLPIARFLDVSLDCLVDYEDSSKDLIDPTKTIAALEGVKSTLSQIIDEKIEKVRQTLQSGNDDSDKIKK